jgi:NADPH-ferrihemoprotein reductase
MHVLSCLARFASDLAEKEHLSNMSTAQGKDLYHDYIKESGRHLAQVLHEHPSIRISTHPYPLPDGIGEPSVLTIGDLFELLPRLQPRYYSISSSPKLHPNQIHITAAVARYQTITGRVGGGVCTTYLDRLCRSDYISRCMNGGMCVIDNLHKMA